MSDTGKLLVVVGPSGVGKGTVIRQALEQDPTIWLSVSVTGREPRSGEVNGTDYVFVSREEFATMAQSDALLEWAEYAGNPYGTPRQPVQERLSAGQSVILEIDIAGARQVKANLPEAVLVFLAPPDVAELERRLRGRGTETEESVQRRLAIAQTELAAEPECDLVIVNDDVQVAAAQLIELAHR
ncbi:MAG: guanylate kinase [Actinobacteria bacterium]|uniref:guanylate kinase n=1 Tax=freshwater metagenome TaxID=449393 RepID=A0A6J6VGM6_9ZZZZ|nr:guanylate kinase [Actinomycetota bacterium]MSX83451.1 guanylate kinase [Actinomycetota bacterium]MSY32718.1 guanylate kinase [Actinomycetota bacterium]MTA66598.1 guanylate kinase [Actinomycetota bacterium]MTA97550.1 guanylate kinase [Actinomycetota bacterium]